MDPRFFRQYLDILSEAPAARAKPAAPAKPAATPAAPVAATPAAKQTPQGSMSNMPGAKAYSDAADPMAATNAQYQQNLQGIQGERDQRLQSHTAARDAAIQKYGSVTNALSSGEVDAVGPSGDPLQRSSVLTTDLKSKERAAGQDYMAASKEKTGGGHWQYDKKTVNSAMGPITQTSARRIATPTKGEVIRQGLAGGGSLYDRRSTLLDPNTPKPAPGSSVMGDYAKSRGEQPPAPGSSVIQSATAPAPAPTAPTAPAPAAPAAAAPAAPVKPVQEDELVRLKELIRR